MGGRPRPRFNDVVGVGSLVGASDGSDFCSGSASDCEGDDTASGWSILAACKASCVWIGALVLLVSEIGMDFFFLPGFGFGGSCEDGGLDSV